MLANYYKSPANEQKRRRGRLAWYRYHVVVRCHVVVPAPRRVTLQRRATFTTSLSVVRIFTTCGKVLWYPWQ